MVALLMAAWFVGVDTNIDKVVAAMNEKGCPQLFSMLDEPFKKSMPQEKWPSFCDGITAKGGRLTKAEFLGKEANWPIYKLHAERAVWKLGLAFDGSGRINGLYMKPWDSAALERKTPPVAESKVRYRWPLATSATIHWGGSEEESNPHVSNPQQRRATDITIAGADGKTYRGEGQKNDDYLIYGAAIVAAAKGRVVAVVDGVPENVPGVMNPYIVPGNVVIIEHGPGEFAHYCHIRAGTVRVKPGQKVEAGDSIGTVGNSGNSSEPHLHWHLQDSAVMGDGFGVEAIFQNVCLQKDGKMTSASEYRLRKGDVVGPCNPSARASPR